MTRVTIFLLFFILLYSCKNSAVDSTSSQETYDFYPTPTCAELEIYNLSNAVIYFDDKGMVDEKTYKMLPSSQLLAGLVSDTTIVKILEENYNFGVVDFSCEYGATIREVYGINSFPTIIRTTVNGTLYAKIVGITSYASIRKKILAEDLLGY